MNIYLCLRCKKICRLMSLYIYILTASTYVDSCHYLCIRTAYTYVDACHCIYIRTMCTYVDSQHYAYILTAYTYVNSCHYIYIRTTYTYVDTCHCIYIRTTYAHIHEQLELPAKRLDYFSWSNKSDIINHNAVYIYRVAKTHRMP